MELLLTEISCGRFAFRHSGPYYIQEDTEELLLHEEPIQYTRI